MARFPISAETAAHRWANEFVPLILKAARFYRNEPRVMRPFAQVIGSSFLGLPAFAQLEADFVKREAGLGGGRGVGRSGLPVLLM